MAFSPQYFMQNPYTNMPPAQPGQFFLQNPNAGAFQQPGYAAQQWAQHMAPLGALGQKMLAAAGPHLGNGQPLTAQNLGFSRMPPMGAYNAGKQLALTNPPVAQSLLSMVK